MSRRLRNVLWMNFLLQSPIEGNEVQDGEVQTSPAATTTISKEHDLEDMLAGNTKATEGGNGRNFVLKVDDDHKATELKLCSMARPHMRAFHYSWWSFFIAFFIWFSSAQK